jgi:hypothetical protein
MARTSPFTPAQLEALLARRQGWRAGDLAGQLGVSVPTLHRMLQGLAPQVVSAGKARRARYALSRPVRGVRQRYPLYAVDETGAAEEIATVVPVCPTGTWMPLPAGTWPVPDEARDGWWEGLPYPFYDMRPQGYMGRQFALVEHQPLQVPANPNESSDDDILYALSLRGADLPGNLIVGQAAYETWLHAKVAPLRLLDEATLGAAYAELAEQAVGSGVAGASAAGEFPKFTAARAEEGRPTPHVLVKFSGADGSTAVRRWADLLICEHLALEAMRAIPGVDSARSRVLQHAGRTFLELERFDRHGLHGRSPVCSLFSLNAALLGDSSTDWSRLAARLHMDNRLSADTLEQVRRIGWFGKLIGNTDMHLGNLSFRPDPELTLAPGYDMLPMFYAPLAGGEVPEREFGAQPPLPLPPQKADWHLACEAALQFWRRAEQDARISEDFRQRCGANARKVQVWRALV